MSERLISGLKKKKKLIEKKIRFVVARGKDGGWKKWVKVGQKVQSSSYKINKHWGCN